MAMFSSHEKFYFVFAGEGERYYLDSMLHPDTGTYLWMELRESKYDYIYEVELFNTGFLLKAKDESSVQQHNALSSGWFSKIPAIPSGQNCVEIEETALRQWMLDLMTKTAGRMAAVTFSLEAFSRLYQDSKSRKQLNRLIDRPENQHSILIRASMQLKEDQLRLMIDPNGVFAYRTVNGQAICPELEELIRRRSAVPFLEILKQRLDNRFVELNAVTFARLQSLMRNVCFQRNENWSDDELLEYTNILYSWWYLPEIMTVKELNYGFIDQICAKFLPDARNRTDIYVALYEALTSTGGWKAFQDRVVILRNLANSEDTKNFLHTLNRQTVEAKCHVRLANTGLQPVARMLWPEKAFRQAVLMNPALNTGGGKRSWAVMQTKLLRPVNRSFPREHIRYMESYYQSYQDAESQQDYDTMCRAVNAMLFGGNFLYMEIDQNPSSELMERWQKYNDYLDKSKKYFTIRIQNSVSTSGSVYEESTNAIQQAQQVEYKKYLDAMDAMLKIIPDLAESLNTEEVESVMATFTDIVKQHTGKLTNPGKTSPKESQKKASTGTPEHLTADGIEMTAEEAEAKLRAMNVPGMHWMK